MTEVNENLGHRVSEVVSPQSLSRAISHALRHEPWLYELELGAIRAFLGAVAVAA